MPKMPEPETWEQRPASADCRRSGLLHLRVRLTLNGSTLFRHTRDLLVPARGGVYLIHDLRGVLYVGRTQNLHRRFHEHYWLTHNELLALVMREPFGDLSFSWIFAEDARECAALESRLIGWLQPPCNRLIPTLRHNGE